MGCYISEMFIVDGESHKFEIYLNDKNQVFFGDNDDAYGSFFTLDKEDWEQLKAFIDDQYNKLRE